MTGWDPVPQLAGRKRDHSPELQITPAKLSADPKIWTEATTSSDTARLQEAALEEFLSLKEKGAISIINRNQLPRGRTLMKCKWVFKKKYHADGTLDKYRARCTVKGFTQRSGIDYQEPFALTPRSDTGRIMLALTHRFGWHRRQGDVPVAFLNPNLDVDLYMKLPEGFKKENHIILNKKGLYGLKQAAALWYDDVKAFLGTQGMFPTTSDVCLYTNK
ncbi:hypothetical protein K3495_g15188 [Podosphaera aphanis]|nr:hypothetical protein K3495_g15188 [Podosphaera aphanis]